ncbi:SE1832 family protein [Caenibacillus caldisaponilyticus]|jgi:hypothetical protein|uniref:SE1832 family protein n=1 Tax=Caenibacillus caldisaponilyticus TaxID=1674942 RepID=UPI001876356A|nr:SE1832 family protein [Caenibacillus caldisaponilyticus]
MTRKEIEERIAELKADYARLQGDMERLESLGRNVAPTARLLKAIEEELADLRKKL